tara:strand:+ start:117 stop:1043 length:927 start_codon:yes stop_codon:yes gene_type:complete
MSFKKESSLKIYKDLNIYKSISLANFTTWRVGGNAEWFAEPKDIHEIKELIDWSNKNKLTFRIIGAGSNLLINDCEIKGLSISLRKFHGVKVNKENESIEVYAGESIPSLARHAAKAGMHGLEWSIGIPGTVGGAIVMNAGAQGSCIANWLESVKVLPLNGDQLFEISCKDLCYSYRTSRLQNEKFLVVSAKFKLKGGHQPKELMHITNQNLNHRKSTQPYNLPSCGSVFRNPEPLKAGKIIEELDLKGFGIGGAEISHVHANFIINKGDASAADINALIYLVQKKVKNAYGIELHTEVKKVGFNLKN